MLKQGIGNVTLFFKQREVTKQLSLSEQEKIV